MDYSEDYSEDSAEEKGFFETLLTHPWSCAVGTITIIMGTVCVVRLYDYTKET